jgi:hypothetical protein
MAVKYINIFHSKAFQNRYVYQNWDFCYSNKPSGNPVCAGEGRRSSLNLYIRMGPKDKAIRVG